MNPDFSRVLDPHRRDDPSPPAEEPLISSIPVPVVDPAPEPRPIPRFTPVSCIVLLRWGDKIAACYTDGHVRVSDVPLWTVLQQFVPRRAAVAHAAALGEDKLILLYEDCEVSVVDMDKEEEELRFSLPGCRTVGAWADRICCGLSDGEVWVVRCGIAERLKMGSAPVTAILGDLDCLYAADRDGLVCRWDAETMEKTEVLSIGSEVTQLRVYGGDVFAGSPRGLFFSVEGGGHGRLTRKPVENLDLMGELLVLREERTVSVLSALDFETRYQCRAIGSPTTAFACFDGGFVFAYEYDMIAIILPSVY